LPVSAKHPAATNPTYPAPMTLIFIHFSLDSESVTYAPPNISPF